MEYIRLVYPGDYDHERGKFNDLAFKNSTASGGLSIFEVDCARSTSIDICKHINNYYRLLTGDPPIFYVMDESEIPMGGQIIETISDSGDLCHREIVGVRTKTMKKAFDKKRERQFFHICDPNAGG